MTDIDSRVSTVLAAKLFVSAANGRTLQQHSDDEIRRRRDLVHSCIASHDGREFGSGGNEIHAEFSTTLNAIACAEAIVADMQNVATDNQKPADGIGIGISLGDVRDDNQELYGSAVDTANAVRAMAAANEIIVAGAVREQARERTDLAFRRLERSPGQSTWVSAYILTGKDAARSGYTFIQELIRRRVFRAAGAYIIVCWILVQVASIVFPEFDAPWHAMRTLVMLLTVGFPLAVFLAWTVDVSTKGLRVTPDSQYSRSKGNVLRFGVVGIATAMSAAVLWWVWSGYIEPTTQRPTRAAIKTNPVIAVHAPRKIAGPDDIDWLGEGVANLIRNDLADSRHVVVLSQSRWNAIAAEAESPNELMSVAKKAGIDYVIAGDYLQTPGGIVLTSRIEDVTNGIEVQGARLRKNDATEVIAATAEIGVQIRQALKIPLQEKVSRFAADFAIQNMDAYEAYIAGLGYFIDFDFQFAEQAFVAALAIAPNFHIARFRLAEVMQATGRSELARTELEAIPDDTELTERERLYIEGAKSSFVADRDPTRSIEVYRELVEKYPYDLEGGQHLADAYWLNYQEDESIAEFRRLTNLHSYDPASWMALGERLLDVGELDEAEQTLQKYLQMAPDDHFAVALLGNLAQLQSKYSESVDFYNRSLALKPGFAVASLGLARSRYLEGAVDTAESLWSALIDDSSQAARFRIDAAFDLAGVLRGQGRFAESMRPLESLQELIAQEGLWAATMQSTLGSTHLEMQQPKLALTLIAQSISESPVAATRHLFARGMLELQQERYGQLQNTVAEIQALALPPDNPDRTEDKAVSFLMGLAALQQNDLATAAAELSSAVNEEGYEYAVYKLGLARLHLASGDLADAAVIAEQAMTARDPGDLRLDLELDRARAMLLHAEILADMGSVAESRSRSQQFIDRWQAANEQATELQRARRLLSAK